MRELVFSVTLDDCVVETKRGTGKGGQNRNKRDTAVRIVHPPSGAVGEAQEERSQLQNKRKAFERMANSAAFRAWAHAVSKGIKTPKEIEAEVAYEMEHNVKVEVWAGKKKGWVDEHYFSD